MTEGSHDNQAPYIFKMSDVERIKAEGTHLSPQTLWDIVQSRTAHAISCQALQSIPTHCETIEQQGVSFLVRSLDTLARKEQAKEQARTSSPSGKPVNPFLPYEKDLFVTHLSDTHLCLLNKYNVVDHHLLVVTRAFEQQEAWLNPHDFAALWQCLSAINGLGFYNGGKLAGASQPHKHLQLIPSFQNADDSCVVPIEAAFKHLISTSDTAGSLTDALPTPIQVSDALAFDHAIAPLHIPSSLSAPQAGEQLALIYQHLLTRFIDPSDFQNSLQTIHYNLLLTRRWMMIVPRIQESYTSISVNSLGFAGSLFVKDEEQLQLLRQIGPMTILEKVASQTLP
jgi:ATP adenylyltransferase